MVRVLLTFSPALAGWCDILWFLKQWAVGRSTRWFYEVDKLITNAIFEASITHRAPQQQQQICRVGLTGSIQLRAVVVHVSSFPTPNPVPLQFGGSGGGVAGQLHTSRHCRERLHIRPSSAVPPVAPAASPIG